jgi:hypothetical protein
MQRIKFCLPFFLFVMLLLLSCASHTVMDNDANKGNKRDSVSDSGGNGDSYENAIVLAGGKDHTDAVEYEQNYIAKLWGEKDKNWKISEQTTVEENNRKIDMIQVEVIKTGKKHFFFFDVNYYYKKKKTE